MSEHTSDDTTREPGSPEEGELQLRKALSTMNDLQPPRDDLFVERALMRGRARTSRRRSTLLGAAAAVVVVGAVGGGWVAATSGSPSNSVSAGSAAPQVASEGSTAGGNGAKAPESLRSGVSPSDHGGVPSVPSARDATTWFGTLSTRQTNTFDAIEATVASRWPGVLSGAYAADRVGDRVAVAVTRHDPGLEAFVAGAMPSPSDVEFVVKKHPLAEKQKVAREILDQRLVWRSRGVEVLAVTQDGRADQVVVYTDAGSTPGLLEHQYGDIVRVVLSTQRGSGKFPDGSTVPPLQR